MAPSRWCVSVSGCLCALALVIVWTQQTREYPSLNRSVTPSSVQSRPVLSSPPLQPPTQRQCLVCLRLMIQKVLQELKLYHRWVNRRGSYHRSNTTPRLWLWLGSRALQWVRMHVCLHVLLCTLWQPPDNETRAPLANYRALSDCLKSSNKLW